MLLAKKRRFPQNIGRMKSAVSGSSRTELEVHPAGRAKRRRRAVAKEGEFCRT